MNLHYTGMYFSSHKGNCNSTKHYTYIMMPKNASMSFRDCGIFGKRSHLSEKDNFQAHANPIMIFREPVARFISIFHWDLRKNTFQPQNKNQPLVDSFSEFVGQMEQQFAGLAAPQVEYLKRGKLTLDDIHTVMRVEHLSQDFNRFKIKENLTITLLAENCRDKDDAIEKFLEAHPAMAKRIRKLYAEDVELYKEVEERIRKEEEQE